MASAPAERGGSWLAVLDEVTAVLNGVDPASMRAAVHVLADRERRWFAAGQGRSGLVAQMAAMRLMHVGFEAHVVGDATAPSIGAGDGLLVVSGSGETPATLHFARLAVTAGSRLMVVTSQPESKLASFADAIIHVPAHRTDQFGASLFEQSALLLLDSLILDITEHDPQAFDLMHSRHTNLQ